MYYGIGGTILLILLVLFLVGGSRRATAQSKFLADARARLHALGASSAVIGMACDDDSDVENAAEGSETRPRMRRTDRTRSTSLRKHAGRCLR